MTKEVLITICGLQNGPDVDGEPIEMTTVGEYFYKNGKHYVLYEEVMEGESKPTKNRIKFAPGMLELTKNGVVNVHMLFEEHKKTRIIIATFASKPNAHWFKAYFPFADFITSTDLDLPFI